MLVCSYCFAYIIHASLAPEKKMQFGGYLSPLNSLLADSVMLYLFCDFLLHKLECILWVIKGDVLAWMGGLKV